MIYPGGRFFRYFDFVHKNSNNDRGRGMTRKDGLLALLVVVVWGLNFVVIKLGLHNMPPLMLAGLRFMLVAFPGAAVCRPASYSAAPAAGLWPDHKFRSVRLSVLRYRPGYAGRAGLPCAAGASLLHHHPWRLRLWRTSAGQAAGGDRPGDLWRAGAGGGQPWRGACAAGGLYADPRGGAQLGLRQYFQQENHVPGEPAANHVAGGPGAR
ncbi:drug/metabolite transporter permease [Klebsiella pneumoniae subsp. ozaenae]|uniref:Drug/metabolite transporter permease n=1 Tax=Klebsiella pneumoniae subsp. ozaenae TaxID=574 RepID=A0A377ZQT4_KLEPO|nr:drug/metabolite transporter permease [Klebsiella pneumoniae subsp. ozaenae]